MNIQIKEIDPVLEYNKYMGVLTDSIKRPHITHAKEKRFGGTGH